MSQTSAPEILDARRRYCRDMLPRVSRTFALTIPVLREPLREEVGVAYLLCRLLDTIEDHPGLSRAHRDRGFECLLQAMEPELRDLAMKDLASIWMPHPEEAYEDLVRNARHLFAVHDALSAASRGAIRSCLREMAWGMSEFPGPGRNGNLTLACRNLDELERYCHAVAGTVGILLCRLFAPVVGEQAWLDAACADRGHRLGLGLQLTNVLKDRRADRSRGISYIPREWLVAEGNELRLSGKGLGALTLRALDHLEAGHRFVLGIPPAHEDLRLFCLWALHLALATLRVGAEADAPAGRKVDREEVAMIVETTKARVADDRALSELHAASAARTRRAAEILSGDAPSPVG